MTPGDQRGKYIRFDDSGDRIAGRPQYFIVNKKAGTTLGRIFYYATWRCWVSEFVPECVFSNGCLHDIAEFITQLSLGRVK